MDMTAARIHLGKHIKERVDSASSYFGRTRSNRDLKSKWWLTNEDIVAINTIGLSEFERMIDARMPDGWTKVLYQRKASTSGRIVTLDVTFTPGVKR